MTVDITNIQLSEAERRLLADLAEKAGKPWGEVLNEALQHYSRQTPASAEIRRNGAETLFDRLTQHGLLGCLDGGPEDLSTNPAHMEGFGERDQ